MKNCYKTLNKTFFKKYQCLGEKIGVNYLYHKKDLFVNWNLSEYSLKNRKIHYIFCKFTLLT